MLKNNLDKIFLLALKLNFNQYIIMDALEISKELLPFIPVIKPIIACVSKVTSKELEVYMQSKKLNDSISNPKYYEILFQNYICQTWEKCSIVNTLIFPNQQILLETLYQPLNLVCDTKKTKIDSFPNELFDKHRRILICDNAGMGKSTISKFICIQTIKAGVGIPVFIELKKLNSENTILKEFLNQLNSIDKIFNTELALKLLTLDRFVIILDGFDEIVNKEIEFVTKDIKDFILKSSNNLFLLTSRPDSSITSFGDFKMTEISKLTRSESFQLLKRYDTISSVNISEKLILEIESKHDQIKSFLTNPFLVSLLYKSYSFKKNIPSKKSTFYNEVYTALFQEHDLSKDAYHRDKISKLDIQEFRVVLREFAIMTAKIGEIEYTIQNAIKYLDDCKFNIPLIQFKSNKFIEDLLKTVPLFIKDGEYIKWAHKSLQDYFAAEYIIFHPKKINLINSLVRKNVLRYQNILDIVMELDPNLIRHYILPDILNKFINYCESPCSLEKIPFDDLIIRRGLLFEREFVIAQKTEDLQNGFDENEFIESCADDIFAEFTTHRNRVRIGLFAQSIVVGLSENNTLSLFQILGAKGFLGGNILTNIYLNKPSVNTNSIFTDKFVLIKEKQDAKYNDPLCFSSVNQMLKEYIKINRSETSFIPKLEYCKSLLEIITKECSKDDDFLDEF